MTYSEQDRKVVLITGGTSGLGLELVKKFLEMDYFVIATGRKDVIIPSYSERFRLYKVDFCSLKNTSDTIHKICDSYPVDLVINNAGILSPPEFVTTSEGNEYTLQVNFLAHLLINELIIRRSYRNSLLRIVTITSMVYKLPLSDTNYIRTKEEYTPVKAYSDSKLFLAMMCSLLNEKYPHTGLGCISIDPGVFGSSIYRMQKLWFRILYRIAAPFMRRPSKVAGLVARLATEPDTSFGAIYNLRNKKIFLEETGSGAKDIFWKDMYSKIEPYL